MVENESIIAIGERRNALIDEYFYPFSLLICEWMLNSDISQRKVAKSLVFALKVRTFASAFRGLSL